MRITNLYTNMPTAMTAAAHVSPMTSNVRRGPRASGGSGAMTGKLPGAEFGAGSGDNLPPPDRRPGPPGGVELVD